MANHAGLQLVTEVLPQLAEGAAMKTSIEVGDRMRLDVKLLKELVSLPEHRSVVCEVAAIEEVRDVFTLTLRAVEE